MEDSLKFGTSGLRGLAVELDSRAASCYSLAFLRHLGLRDGECLIGSDLRASSPAIRDRVAAGVRAAGLRPFDCGTLPTPALALASLHRRLPAIMVTGSHIPGDRNGLKFYSPAGEITKDDEAGILAALGTVEFDFPSPTTVTVLDALDAYLARCRDILAPAALEGKRIGVWQHSSVFREGLVTILEDLGAYVVALGRSDTFVAVDTEALEPEHEEMLARWVTEHNLDALVSTDGDADRPLVVSDRGEAVRGDILGVLVGRFLHADIAVTPVTSNSTIEDSNIFEHVYRTKVGSPHVVEGMKQSPPGRVAIGFEANGGVLLGNAVSLNEREISALPTRDAALPILAALGLAQELQQPLSSMIDAVMPPRVARSGRLKDIPGSKSTAFLGSLSPEFFSTLSPIESESDIDGRRFKLMNGDVIHYRASGNAPELRCYIETRTVRQAESLLRWGLDAAAAAL